MQKLIKVTISIVSAIIVFLALSGIVSAEATKTGVISADILNVRQTPATTAKILKKLSKGVQVTILSSSNGWYKITVKGTTGWVSSQFISVVVPKIPKGSINAANVNLRSAAGTTASILGKLAKGDKVSILRTVGDWSEVKTESGKTGWVRKDFIQTGTDAVSENIADRAGTEDRQKEPDAGTTPPVNAAAGTNTTDSAINGSPATNGSPASEPGSSSGTGKIIYNSADPNSVTSGQGIGTTGQSITTTGQGIATTGQSITVNIEQMLTFAKSLQGVPYVYGGTTPAGFDCSGFTSYVFANFGIKLNRTAADQTLQGAEVARDALKPGDLVFFDTNGGHTTVNHTGIYLGEGKFIHASSGSSTYCVTISDLTAGFYFENFMTARHLID